MKDKIMGIIDEEISLGKEFLEELGSVSDDVIDVEDIHRIAHVRYSIKLLEALKSRIEGESE